MQNNRTINNRNEQAVTQGIAGGGRASQVSSRRALFCQHPVMVQTCEACADHLKWSSPPAKAIAVKLRSKFVSFRTTVIRESWKWVLKGGATTRQGWRSFGPQIVLGHDPAVIQIFDGIHFDIRCRRRLFH